MKKTKLEIQSNHNNKSAVALLAVLLIVMVITILSLGFLARSDVELTCGQNMILRAQMDYLAESGLEHARSLILPNPPDHNLESWTWTSQIVPDSNDYYSVEVTLPPLVDPCDPNVCDYEITSIAYREIEEDGETIRIGRSFLKAELRVDPNAADPNAEAFFTSIRR
ncbi:MAG: hypothetical protein KAS69_05495 [Planctomycetes bacterium]|nr:hypothetical protein [Planctomycetota bacterium]